MQTGQKKLERTIGQTVDAAPKVDLQNNTPNYGIVDPIQNEVDT
jgi:hypothetical protein